MHLSPRSFWYVPTALFVFHQLTTAGCLTANEGLRQSNDGTRPYVWPPRALETGKQFKGQAQSCFHMSSRPSQRCHNVLRDAWLAFPKGVHWQCDAERSFAQVMMTITVLTSQLLLRMAVFGLSTIRPQPFQDVGECGACLQTCERVCAIRLCVCVCACACVYMCVYVCVYMCDVFHQCFVCVYVFA